MLVRKSYNFWMGGPDVSARARSEPQGLSRWPLEPPQSCRGARNGWSIPPRSRRGASNRLTSTKPFSEPPGPSKLSVRVRSVLEVDDRTRSASLGRSKRMLRSARFRWSIQIGRSSPPGFVGVLNQLPTGASPTIANKLQRVLLLLFSAVRRKRRTPASMQQKQLSTIASDKRDQQVQYQ